MLDLHTMIRYVAVRIFYIINCNLYYIQYYCYIFTTLISAV